ncbi:alpha/beta hydrolase [Sorangium cellulosum]|uniref:Alpha/beta hydrolase n=1 Tax=Sorangium cellulosum TaxID=56 RepID=A0A2L0EU73_SORCE|nr:alpha/beta hydrolase [Sorangium cellulosum]AUX42858.1 alpha/beta hydrolase [Sorangium cellulosum]
MRKLAFTPVLASLLLSLLPVAACAPAPRAELRPAAPPAPSAPPATRPGASPAAGFDPELSSYTYPFPVRYFELESQRQKLRMAYMDVQPEKPNGRTVLLLHGKNFSGAYWEPTIRALSERGFRVIAPDQIGFGKSTKPAAYQFSFHGLAEATRALLDSLGVQRAAVVGHSMGGMLAARYALMFEGRAERLVLVNPIGLEDWKTVVPYRSIDAWFKQELAATPDSIRDYQRKSYYDGAWKPEYERLIEIPAGWTRHPEYARVAWCSALTYDMIFTQPVVYELPRLRTPTLLIIGLRDRTALGRAWAPKEAADALGDYTTLGKKAAQAIPGAKLVEIPGVGHMPQVEAFDKYREALLGFLEQAP